jgi:hypothetical protein
MHLLVPQNGIVYKSGSVQTSTDRGYGFAFYRKYM